MSFYPCDIHGQRIRGPLSAFYPALLSGGDRLQRRMRLCADCLDGLLETYGDKWQLVDAVDAGGLDLLCAGCRNEIESSVDRAAFFATAYRKGAERADYFAAYCNGCASALATSLQLVA